VNLPAMEIPTSNTLFLNRLVVKEGSTLSISSDRNSM
jgi:hypothetical protein